jgi:hypothetical protein
MPETKRAMTSALADATSEETDATLPIKNMATEMAILPRKEAGQCQLRAFYFGVYSTACSELTCACSSPALRLLPLLLQMLRCPTAGHSPRPCWYRPSLPSFWVRATREEPGKTGLRLDVRPQLLLLPPCPLQQLPSLPPLLQPEEREEVQMKRRRTFSSPSSVIRGALAAHLARGQEQ